MKKEATSLPGVFLFHPDVFPDSRGEFLEHYNKKVFAELGIEDDFVQDSLSISKKNVLRGLHFQTEPYAQAKLVSVIAGEVFDVAVDIRVGSPTYGQWFGVNLSGTDHTLMYVPRGFAHGFYVLSDEARFFYKISGGAYNKEASKGIIWNDPQLDIHWPLMGNPIVSEQDGRLPKLTPAS